MNQSKKYILQALFAASMLNSSMPAQAIDWSYWSNYAHEKISGFVVSSKNQVVDCLQQPEVWARALVSAAVLVTTTYYTSYDRVEQSDDDSNVGDNSGEYGAGIDDVPSYNGSTLSSPIDDDSSDEYGAGIDDLQPYNELLENKVRAILASPLPDQGDVSKALLLIDKYRHELNQRENEVLNAASLKQELASRRAHICQREEEAADREIASRDKIEHFLKSRFLSRGYTFEQAAVDLYLQKGDFSDKEGQSLLTQLTLRKINVRLRCEDVYYRERERLKAERKNLQAELVAMMELQHKFGSKEAGKQET